MLRRIHAKIGTVCHGTSRGHAVLVVVDRYKSGAGPEPLPEPNTRLAVQGSVNAQAILPNGDLVIGGRFALVNGVACHDIARLRPDGRVVADWCPRLDTFLGLGIEALAADDRGNVFAGGVVQRLDGDIGETIVKLMM